MKSSSEEVKLDIEKTQAGLPEKILIFCDMNQDAIMAYHPSVEL